MTDIETILHEARVFPPPDEDYSVLAKLREEEE